MISFKDFQKLNLRVGNIVKVEKIPESTKLLKLEVDLGEEKRTILAGISKYYNDEELVGKQIIVVSNLEPKEICGIESRGMVLGVLEGDRYNLLTVDKLVKPGGRIL